MMLMPVTLLWLLRVKEPETLGTSNCLLFSPLKNGGVKTRLGEPGFQKEAGPSDVPERTF